MKIIYIAHPISGKVTFNLKLIVEIVRHINLNYSDIVPLVPYYVDILALDDSVEVERNRGIQNDIAVIRSGLIQELISLAMSLNIPVLYKPYPHE